MASVKKVTEMLYRIKNGESVTTADWDTKIVPKTVRSILKKYDLQKTYNEEVPVNQDRELADRFFDAGLELAETLGIHCTDTETVVKYSHDELLSALDQAPSELHLGCGTDQVTIGARKPEDKKKPLFCASLSIQVDEDIYPTLVEGLVSYKGIDILQGPSIDTVFGMPVFSGTPFETTAGIRESQLRTEALARAGRPGMQQMGMSSSVTEYGLLCGLPLTSKPYSPVMGICLQPSELKTNYCNFHKVLAAASCGAFLRTGCPSMIGGYSGPPEGAVIANIASDILQFALFGTDISNCSMFDIRHNSACCRTGLWAMSMSVQATSQNTHTILDKIINQNAGPCTEEILYTSAAGLIATSVSGMELTTGPRSAGGSLKNYLTPLEGFFCADVFKAAADLTLDKAEELVEYCLSKYESDVDNQPKGKSFYDCYDVKTLTPSDEWKAIDQKVRTDLRQRGLAI